MIPCSTQNAQNCRILSADIIEDIWHLERIMEQSGTWSIKRFKCFNWKADRLNNSNWKEPCSRTSDGAWIQLTHHPTQKPGDTWNSLYWAPCSRTSDGAWIQLTQHPTQKPDDTWNSLYWATKDVPCVLVGCVWLYVWPSSSMAWGTGANLHDLHRKTSRESNAQLTMHFLV